MSRKEKTYHFVYKTIDTRNGNFYIGMHSTDNLNDGYVGSGTRLKRIIYKHGKEILKMEILEFLPDRISLKNKEIEIVNSDLLKEENCINLKCGGEGGFCNDEHREIFLESSKLTRFSSKNNPSYTENHKKMSSSVLKHLWDSGKIVPSKSFKGKSHSEESKQKIREKNKINQKGEKNSQFGTCWITNGVENKKLKKEDIIPEGWKLGYVVEKMKGYQWITNGTECKLLKKNDVIPKDWVFGRLYKLKNELW